MLTLASEIALAKNVRKQRKDCEEMTATRARAKSETNSNSEAKPKQS